MSLSIPPSNPDSDGGKSPSPISSVPCRLIRIDKKKCVRMTWDGEPFVLTTVRIPHAAKPDTEPPNPAA